MLIEKADKEAVLFWFRGAVSLCKYKFKCLENQMFNF